MSDINVSSGQSVDTIKIAAAVSAFLDLPRVMRELEVTLRQLRSVVTGAEDRRADRLTDAERGLWNAVQVASFLRVSRSWVYHRAESGLLPCRHVGGLLRFEAEAIREYAHTGKVPDPVSTEREHRAGIGIGPARAAATTRAKPPAPSPPSAVEAPIQAPSPERQVSFESPSVAAPRTSQLLGVREVAERLRVSTATVYKLCDRAELAHTRIVNVIRVTREDLEAFIAQRGSKSRRQ